MPVIIQQSHRYSWEINHPWFIYSYASSYFKMLLLCHIWLSWRRSWLSQFPQMYLNGDGEMYTHAYIFGRTSLCGPGCIPTHNPLPLAFWVLWLQVFTKLSSIVGCEGLPWYQPISDLHLYFDLMCSPDIMYEMEVTWSFSGFLTDTGLLELCGSLNKDGLT